MAYTTISDPNSKHKVVAGKKGIEGCQVQTPMDVVELVWHIVQRYRRSTKKVIDFGAGDAIFSTIGNFEEYIGVEIDSNRFPDKKMPFNVKLIHDCVLNVNDEYDLCIGNPPYVRHHDIDPEWKKKAINLIKVETNIKVNELSNLFSYFIWLSLLRTKSNGLIALIVPYEWVSRPSFNHLRNFINKNRWKVDIYRFKDSSKIFPKVLTTASLTIIDKSKNNGIWNYFEIEDNFNIRNQKGITGTGKNVLPYVPGGAIRARRGFSPGTQKVFTLTEKDRIKHSIKSYEVIPCVTTFRMFPSDIELLDESSFKKYFVDAGLKCWLLKTEGDLSNTVSQYLECAPESEKMRSTCKEREVWYRYKFPLIPSILYSSGFVRFGPKFVINQIKAIGLSSVHGIISENGFFNAHELISYLRDFDFESQIVPHAHTLKKVEVNQMNWVITHFYKENHFMVR